MTDTVSKAMEKEYSETQCESSDKKEKQLHTLRKESRKGYRDTHSEYSDRRDLGAL